MNESDERYKNMPELKAIIVAEGLGYGSGPIAVEARVASETDELDETILSKVDALIESQDILIAVDVDDDGKQIQDDGCGDGRGVKIVWQGNTVKKRSLNRAKVFGGGATMGVGAAIANGSLEDLTSLFSTTINRLDERKIPFGAHTDEHAHGDNCGCGAIDKAPEIIQNAVLYKQHILSSIEAITGQSAADNALLSEVYETYEGYAAAHNAQPYAGAKVMSKIIDSGKIVKQLEGKHYEVRVVINTVPNYTVNQAAVRDATDNKAQVFAVDEWRLKQIAEGLYDTDNERNKAYLGMLIYTLATAGTLTPGDLKVYAIADNKQFALAA